METREPPRRRFLGMFAVPMTAVTFNVAPAPAGATARPATARSLRIVDLGTLEGVCCSEATAINDHGDIVGSSNVGPPMSASHAFLWHRRRMHDLGTLGGNNSSASDISNRGDVVGWSDVASGATHAFLWRRGRMSDLGTLGGDNSYASAVNDNGQVVGWSETETPGLHAFLWHRGNMSDLGTLNGGSALAYDINNRGQGVGDSTVDGMNSVPVRWWHGTLSRLSAGYGQGSAINNKGEVTGYFFGNGSFLWSRGRLIDLGNLPGATFVQALGINDRAQVVGYTDYYPFIWQRGHMTALPRLMGSATSAVDINNRGQIVGSSATTPDGLNAHAVLWTR